MSMYRANVLQFLALQTDVNGVPTGRRVVNDADLQARGLPPHTVKLPKFGTGNVVPESAGATLVVFFRDPDEAAAQDRPVRRHLRTSVPGA